MSGQEQDLNRDNAEMQRSFLLVVDASAELSSAVRFACRRALHTAC